MVFLTGTGAFHGWQSVRESAAELARYVSKIYKGETMNGDLTLHNYQDDFDTDQPDEFINEAVLAPADMLGIPEEEYKKELDNLALDDLERDNEDLRETIEDKDEADDNAASTA